MLTTEQLGNLKQVNISKDSAKTAERAEQLWKSQKNATKADLLALAGCTGPTVHRIYKNGNIHIKLAIAFGQVLSINPYYLTGEADEPGEFSEVILLQLLEQHGYTNLAAELAPAEAAPAPEAEAEPVSEPEPEVVPEPEVEPEVVTELEIGVFVERAPAPKTDIDISEEDMQALLHSLVILDRAGVVIAQEKLAAVKGILVS
jgi:hypothetical protein